MSYVIEATLNAIGSEDAEIGGQFSTRLTAPVAKGATTFLVESTLGWPDSGKLALGGVAYSYTSKSNVDFSGISYEDEGATVAGAYKAHLAGAEVLDINRQRTALDKVRRAVLVNTAEGPDLSVAGRNVGVNRLPFAVNDDRYREIIKALAYNPKGTTYGIEQALNGIVGEGNFEILEDPFQYPNQVVLKIKDTLVGTVSTGKTYLTSSKTALATSVTNVNAGAFAPPAVVKSVRLKDEEIITDCRKARPSAHIISEYQGDSRSAWSFIGYSGGSGGAIEEAAQVALIAGTPGNDGYCRMADTHPAAKGYYWRLMRVTPASDYDFGMRFALDPLASLGAGATMGRQWCQGLEDGGRFVLWGVCQGKIGFIDGSGGLIDSSTAVALPAVGTWAETRVRRRGDRVELWLDEVFVQAASWTSFASVLSGGHKAIFGAYDDTGAASVFMRVQNVWFTVSTPTDYWEKVGDTAYLSDGTHQVDLGVAVLGASDEGKTLWLGHGALGSPGVFFIESVLSPSEALVAKRPAKVGASVSAAHSNRIVIDDPEAFHYPEDVGAKVVLSGSTRGNDGEYVISKILDPDTMEEMVSGENYSHAVEVTALFSSEEGLTWALYPVFSSAADVPFRIAGKGTVSPPNSITLATPLPFDVWAGAILEIEFTSVLSGHLLEDADVPNQVSSLGPPVTYDYYPAYLVDSVGFVAEYADDILAAGILPVYQTKP